MEATTVLDQLTQELLEVFGGDGLNRSLATEVVAYLDTEGFLDYDTLKEIYSDE